MVDETSKAAENRYRDYKDAVKSVTDIFASFIPPSGPLSNSLLMM